MQFYDLKMRSHVEVDDSLVFKLHLIRETRSGTQDRYAFCAMQDLEGGEAYRLYKFVGFAQYAAAPYPAQDESGKDLAPSAIGLKKTLLELGL